MDLLDMVQWPAMAITVLGAWYTGSSHKTKRAVGFWAFLLSNALWITWGVHDTAWALVVLQVVLAVINIRNARHTKEAPEPPEEEGAPAALEAA